MFGTVNANYRKHLKVEFVIISLDKRSLILLYTPEVPLFATPWLSEKVLRKGENCPKNGKFSQKYLVHYFFFLNIFLGKPKMPRKITLQIKNETLELYNRLNRIYLYLLLLAILPARICKISKIKKMRILTSEFYRLLDRRELSAEIAWSHFVNNKTILYLLTSR